MKIQLVVETRKVTGVKYYSVEIDGCYCDNTLTRDPDEAKKIYAELLESAKLYPADKKEILATVDL